MTRIRIYRTILLATLVASLMLLLPATASARVGVGIGFYGGPYGYYGGPYGYYGGPYGYPYAYGAYGYPYGPYGGRPLGEVHIKSPEHDAEIYINGSFAGHAHDLKHIYLAPGRYNIEQRIGNDVQKQRIYVVAYRRVKIEFGKPGTPSPQPLPQAEPRPDAGGPPPPPAPAPGAGN
jgi:hypothetical protein